MKKKIIFTIIVFLLVKAAFSQANYPVVKAYAYSQKEISGINHKAMDKDGKIIRGKNLSIHYFLYLECYAGKEILVDNVWINGIVYKVEVQKTESPVVINSGIKGVKKTAADTLVPQTGNAVLLIKSGNALDVKTNKKIGRLAKNNAVVFTYVYNNKRYYFAVKSLKEITPEINQ